MIRIAQYRGVSLVSRIIKFVTRGKYSHTAIMLSDDEVVEAWEGCSRVRVIKNLSDGHRAGTPVDIYELPCSTAQEAAFLGFIAWQIGKKYDRFGLLAFFLNTQKLERQHRWFCSELLAGACEYAGIELIKNAEHWQVSPTMVTRSPLPIFIKSVTT